MNTIFECYYVFLGWEIGHLLSTYATGGIRGVGEEWRWRSSDISTGAYRGKGVERLVIRYVRTKWIVPNKFCETFFVH